MMMRWRWNESRIRKLLSSDSRSIPAHAPAYSPGVTYRLSVGVTRWVIYESHSKRITRSISDYDHRHRILSEESVKDPASRSYAFTASQNDRVYVAMVTLIIARLTHIPSCRHTLRHARIVTTSCCYAEYGCQVRIRLDNRILHSNSL